MMTTRFSSLNIKVLGLALITGLAASAYSLDASAAQRVAFTKGVSKSIRVRHARELLGSRYPASVVRSGEKISKVDQFVLEWTRENLPEADRRVARKLARAIIEESAKHEFDPIFLMSVIQSESSFNPHTVGGVGEIGLMQIRPETGAWIARANKIAWKGKKTLFDPVANVRIGAAFLAKLRDQFDSHARLYLAAYNMGAANVRDALERNVWPKDYPRRVMENYVAFYEELKEKLGRKSGGASGGGEGKQRASAGAHQKNES